MKRIKKDLILFMMFGSFYVAIEILFRNKSDRSMFVLGGLCGVLIGLLNEWTTNMSIKKQCLISAIIVTVLEFITGYIVNIKLGLGVWDYSRMPFNLCGQICLLYSVLWYFLSLVAIWVDDYLRYKLFGEEYKGDLLYYIKLLFMEVK